MKHKYPHLGRVRQSLSLIVTTLAAAAATGCAVGPDFQRPAVPAAEAYTREQLTATASASLHGGEAQHFATGIEVDRRWWTAFGSRPLDALVEQAFTQNPSLASAQAALRQARENTAAQFGSYFPTVQAGYARARQKDSANLGAVLSSGEPLYTLHTSQVTVSYVPDVFGLNRRAVESLRAQEEALRFQVDAAYQTLAANVVSAAIQEAALRAQVVAAEGMVDTNRHALDILQRQAKLGVASGLDLAMQQSALAQAEQTLPPLRKQLEQTRNLLATLVGKLPVERESENLDLEAIQLPTELPVSLPSRLVENRPDVRAAEAQLHAASAQVGIAIANRLPQFALVGIKGGSATSFGEMFKNGNPFWNLTGSVTQTLFDFGTLKHRQGAAEAALDMAAANYRSTVLTAFQNVADSLYAVQEDAKMLAAGVDSEVAAKKTLDLIRRQLQLGAVNVLALYMAEQAYLQAHSTRLQTQAARYTDTVALFLALGGNQLEDDQRVHRTGAPSEE
ncbi:MAG: efflux transporter outer membrane subunit [Betaproteobacteria bacterium]|nr:efflux transporter outer membrane subunit [Betaproteobacteria bacterium]